VAVGVKSGIRAGRDGQEVVQLYVKHMGSKVERPIEELKGFQRVALKAGETKIVQIALKAKGPCLLGFAAETVGGGGREGQSDGGRELGRRQAANRPSK